jgi:hypothetical protein
MSPHSRIWLCSYDAAKRPIVSVVPVIVQETRQRFPVFPKPL